MADLKTLKVCLSSELPSVSERSSDYIYLAYNKLALYIGKNEVEDSFAIAESMPDEPVPGMIYILNTDGTVHRYIDYTDTTIANIESTDQIDILKKAGTVFFSNADRRYVDSQKRTLTLPFNDGSYELSVAVKNDQKFDDNTIVKYNPDHERFEVFGDDDEDFIDFSKPFRGATTDSIKVKVNGSRIIADALISAVANNALKKASDGLYIDGSSIVTKEEFEKWSDDITDLKNYANDIIDRIDSDINAVRDLITEDAINADILARLKENWSTDIETALANYKTVVEEMASLSTEIMGYASSNISATSTTLTNTLETNSKWTDLSDLSDFTQEVDYYDKAEKYIYPDLTEDEIKAAIAAVLKVRFENISLE